MVFNMYLSDNVSGRPSLLSDQHSTNDITSNYPYHHVGRTDDQLTFGPLGLSYYQCFGCPQRFESKMLLAKHMSLCHSSEMPFSCTLCGKGYATQSGLNHHRRLHDGKSYTCPVCDVKMSQKSNVKQHMKNVHNVAQCVKCDKIIQLEVFKDHVSQCYSGESNLS